MTVRILMLACLLLAGCAGFSSSNIEKPASDTRQYEYIELDNKLKVMLISDPKSTKAAVSLDVLTGSGSDPVEHQGLAHFLEHMLFLGTQKYPAAGEYQAFLTAHGGNHNAFTSLEHTNYFFDIEPEHLEPALDRFSQFFIAPLFTPEYVDREKNAVHSEYFARIGDEQRRNLDAMREVVNPRHPMAKFSVGSLETLSDTPTSKVREALLLFYRQHYSANVMTLVVSGQQDLPTLKAMVVKRFKEVPNRGVMLPATPEPLFAPGTLPALLQVIPKREVRQLSLTFPVPDAEPYYREKPLEYLGHLLGHEGQGSLLAALKAEGLAEGLSAGNGMSYRGGSTFSLSINLTNDGLAQWETVVDRVFQSIKRIQQEGVQSWVYDELAVLGDLDFQYREPGEPLHRVLGMANDLHYYPAGEVLVAPYRFAEFDKDLIGEYLSYLKPDNMLVMLASQQPVLPPSRESKWFHAPYGVASLTPGQVKRWQSVSVNAAIALPAPNPYLPDGLETHGFKGLLAQKPDLGYDDGRLRIWHKLDDRFLVPKASVYLNFKSPLATRDATSAALLALYAQVLEDALKPESYPANLAGLDFGIRANMRGISVRLGGYDQAQGRLLQSVVSVLRAREFDPDRVDNLRRELVRNWRNAQVIAPYQRFARVLSSELVQPSWPESELAAAAEHLTVAQLQDFAEAFWAEVQVDALVNGNYKRDAALALVKGGVAPLLRPGAAKAISPLRVLTLPDEALAESVTVRHGDQAVLLYWQGRSDHIDESAFFALTAQLGQASFYHSLRTEQQLGYVVYASAFPLLTIPGLAFVVESPTASADAIATAMTDYVQGFFAGPLQPTSVDYDKARQALIQDLQIPPSSLEEESERYWQEIALGRIDFDYRERLVEAIRGYDFERWRARLDAQVGANRGWLWMYKGDFTRNRPARSLDEVAKSLTAWMIQ